LQSTTLMAALIPMLCLSACAATAPATTPVADSAPAVKSERHNVILFLGDGMGVSTVTAARIMAGQQAGGPGEDAALSFEGFPHVALVKTYNTDSQVSDSAGTMTAIVTGEKTRIGSISVAASVSHNDCPNSLNNELPTLLEQAEDAGIATGVISTARITHATPAATYSHAPNRDWEADSNLPAVAAAAGCRDLATQLVEFDHGNGIELALGGGRAQFMPSSVQDPEYPDRSGIRADNRNLLQIWQQQSDGHYVWNRAAFEQVPEDGKKVLGLFEPSHMQFEADREKDPAGEPSLSEMTAFAIQRLQRQGDTFFLMVEGGRIDHGHHAGNAYRALTDTIEFANAVQTAMDLTSEADTLILVTADHSHTLTMSGYPRRGNPILGKVTTPLGGLAKDSNGQPYTTLGYANGPGYQDNHPDLTDVDTQAPNYQQRATLPMPSETHGGEDVAAYAQGPNADTLHGVIEQNLIYNVLRGALFGTEN